ncbi:hypothetical protein EOA79_30865 [Mesorhizobium sp. M1A.F.Ca.IN.020.03.2.1]|nr:hypothetical protein EOA79_30865 [Mesorhizobium sp. M1A.F.Ca.IN.020.03.2.1]RWG87117.1 MAG: hypothetical protein EOQ70_13840 [Mesorhizobium sp.]RWK18245.1 MAG: hypothetical protein EOR41_13895 [Mesorhizobium sp.]
MPKLSQHYSGLCEALVPATDLEQAAPMAAYLAALFLLYAVMVSGTSMSGVASSNGAYPKLKQFCRVATRFEKPPVNYRPVATVAAIVLWLR